MTMLISISGALRLLPQAMRRSLDGWSRRIAQERMVARRQRGLRKVQPLPPVLNGRAYLPHPWRD